MLGQFTADQRSRIRISGNVLNFLTTIAIVILSMANSIALARWLEPAGRGEVTAALLWPQLLPYLGITGMIDSLVYFSADEDADTTNTFANSMAFGTAVTVALGVLGFAAMPWLLSNQSTDVVVASRLLLIGMPLTAWAEFSSSLLRAKMRLGTYNVQRLLTPVGYLAGTVILYLLDGLTVLNIVLVQLALVFMRVVLSMLMARACKIELGFAPDWDEMKRMLHFGNRAHLGAVAEFSNKRLDQALIAAWLPPAQLGLYVVAVNSTSVMLTLAQAMKITVLPQLARERERDRQVQALLDVFRRYWTLSLIASPVFALVLYWAIPFVYGEAYQGATWSALILVLDRSSSVPRTF